MRKIDKQQYKNLLFILPSLLGVSVFVLIPSIDVFGRSFLNATTQEFVGIQNYETIFHNKAFLMASENTLKFIGVCVPALMIISLAIAVFLMSGIKGGHLFKSAYLIPMAIPVASIALIWRVMFHEQGIFNHILSILHMQDRDWMNSNSAFLILVFSYIWKNMGYNIVLWMAGLLAIPKSLYEAAEVDGAGKFKCFLYITLPNMKSMFFIVTILAVLNSFKSFREAYLVAGDYPHQSIYLLQHLFNNWYRELSLDKLSAAAVVVSIVIFICIMFLQKFWVSDSKRG
jgi:multiple sugar transport system permease protein